MERRNLVMALGFFDGVHKGHMQLIEETLNVAKKKNLTPAVMTFKTHPLKRIFPKYAPELLTDNQEKIHLILETGISNVYLEPFTEDLMRLSPEAFIAEYLLKKYPVKHLVVGFNYSFGYKGAGKSEDLRVLGEKYGFEISVIPPYIVDQQAISSTLIRNMIKSGRVHIAADLLGRAYDVTGEIVCGKQLGHTFGIPTANLQMTVPKILPENGVYYTKATIDGREFDGLTNLGNNPTFAAHPYAIETYLYDVDADLYGKTMTLRFIEHIRSEIKFADVQDLIAQIRQDIAWIDREYRSVGRQFGR